ncbi:MAG: ParA family protein [Pontixanthobacter sp.]
MAVVAIYSIKGGVGKTTLAANLAYCAATHSGHRTVLWDLDPSSGGGYLLGAESHQRLRAESLFTIATDPGKLLVKTAYERLGVLPADESIRSIDIMLARPGRRKHLGRIINALSRAHDMIFLDCPPAINELSRQILQAADVVIVPLPPSPLSTRAFQRVASEVKHIGKRHPPILPVLSMVDLRRNLHREAKSAAPDWPMIPFSSAAEQCAVRQQPVGVFARNSDTARSIEHLWRAIETKVASQNS